MSDDIKRKVTRFLTNLELQLEDLRLRDQQTAVDMCLDCTDVSGAVLGMHAFCTPGAGFARVCFEDPKTLVQCLAASGWLGPFQMLPPHQSEFLTLLSRDFGLGSMRDTAHDVAEFMSAIRLDTEIDIHDTSPEKMVEFIRSHASLATHFFKALHCINGSWHERLIRWRRSGLLTLDRAGTPYQDIIATPHFRRLIEAFHSVRRCRPRSNFADACALSILIERVASFNAGREKRASRFYVSTQTFARAVDRADLADLFVEIGPTGTRMSVLRDAEYFIYRAMFMNGGLDESIVECHRWRREELEELRSALSELVGRRDVTVETIDNIQVFGKPLHDFLNELEQLSFFANVWLPYSGRRDAAEALHRVGDVASRLSDNTARKAAENALKDIRRELARNVREYRRISGLWIKLGQAVNETMAEEGKALIELQRRVCDRYGSMQSLKPR